MTATKIQLRRDTVANWSSANPVLSAGEIGIATDSSPVKFKIGDGTTTWNSLSYFGNVGDMTVAVYDPTGVHGDAFNTDNHHDGSTNGVYTLAERTKLAGIATGADVTTAASVGAVIHGATTGTLADAYEFAFWNTVGSVLDKITWANIKSTIGTALGAMISALTSKTTPVDADLFVISDSAASNASKKLAWSDLKATLKTYFDTVYASGSSIDGGNASSF